MAEDTGNGIAGLIMPHFDENVAIGDIAEQLYQRLVALKKQPPLAGEQVARRRLVAVAGVPGSGKSTVTAAVAKLWLERKGKPLMILPMDGYHLTRAALRAMPDPEEAFVRRGAAFTFDAQAFIKLVRRLRNEPVTKRDDSKLSFKAPSFDHAVKDPVVDDIYLSSAEDLIILEGNYLLLDEPPWREIADLVDEKWFVDASEDVAKERVVLRHLAAGIENSRVDAEARVDSNDTLNGRQIRQHLIKPDVIVRN